MSAVAFTVAGLVPLVLLVVIAWADVAALLGGALVGGWLVLDLSLGALLVVLIHQSAGGDWGRAIQAPLTALALGLPVAAAAFVALLLAGGYEHLQARAAQAATGGKAWYLAEGPLALRTALAFAVWLAVALVVRWRVTPGRRRPAVGAVGLIVTMPSLLIFTYDWMVALDPHWYSSAIGLELAAAALPGALACALLAAAGEMTKSNRRSLARLLLGALLLFGYVAFMEFLIIWSAHMPHEVAWYAGRNHGGWQGLLLAVTGVMVLAGVALMFRRVRRTPGGMRAVAVAVLLGHFGWLCWMLLPGLGGRYGLAAVLGAAFLGAWLAAVCQWLRAPGATDVPTAREATA